MREFDGFEITTDDLPEMHSRLILESIATVRDMFNAGICKAGGRGLPRPVTQREKNAIDLWESSLRRRFAVLTEALDVVETPGEANQERIEDLNYRLRMEPRARIDWE